jgi:hypothetical protein
VVISELMVKPASQDWNGDGVVDLNDQWIELHNTTMKPVNISGWLLDTGPGTAQYRLPKGTVIKADGYAVRYRSSTGLELPYANGAVRLIRADGQTVEDSVSGYPALAEDGVYSRDLLGSWHEGWPSSPGAPNSPLEHQADLWRRIAQLPLFSWLQSGY